MNDQLPVVQSDAASLMAVIARAASDTSIDVDKLERLMGLYERIEGKRAEQAFNAAMVAAQSEMPRILKNKENDHTKTRYANLEAVITIVTPIYTRNGFSLSFGTADCPTQGRFRVICHVSHSGGYSRDYQADLPADAQGAKNPTQGFGSSMSYGRRYLTMLIFNLATTDDDDGNGGANSGTIDADQHAKLAATIAEVGADEAKFLKFMGVQKLGDLPAAKFDYAMRALDAKRAKS